MLHDKFNCNFVLSIHYKYINIYIYIYIYLYLYLYIYIFIYTVIHGLWVNSRFKMTLLYVQKFFFRGRTIVDRGKTV